VVAVPVQPPPDQPANVEPDAGDSVNVTTVPLANVAEQVPPHVIPDGLLETEPEPVPALLTVNVRFTTAALKVAVTDLSASMLTLQAPVPLHAPDQPAKVDPPAGVAVRPTVVPVA